MHHRTSNPLAAWLVVVLVSPAAAVFDPVSDGRAIHAEFFDPFFSQVLDDVPPTAFGAWNGQVVAGGAYLAEQISEAVTAKRMAARGSAAGASETGAASSTFSIVFDVDAPTEYLLTGMLTENPSASNEARLLLTQGASVIFSADANAGIASFDDTGTLAAGQYELLATASWDDSSEFLPPGIASFDFIFTVVPEPGTGSLLALGLIGIARRMGRSG